MWTHRQTDRQTNKTQLIIALLYLANAPEKFPPICKYTRKNRPSAGAVIISRYSNSNCSIHPPQTIRISLQIKKKNLGPRIEKYA